MDKVFAPFKVFRDNYFTTNLITSSSTAEKLGIYNGIYSGDIFRNCVKVLSMLRYINDYMVFLSDCRSDFSSDFRYAAFRISSFYRCPELNSAVNGAPRSAHMSGKAVDLVLAPGYSLKHFLDALPLFCIKVSYYKQYKTHIHVTFDF